MIEVSQIFSDENHSCEIDFSSAFWATDQLYDIFHNAGLTIWHDVDFVAETNDELLLVEYKNSNLSKAVNAFNPLEEEKLDNVARKYYESSYYLQAVRQVEQKKKKFVYILEHKNGDSVMRKMVRKRLSARLPFRLQNQLALPGKWIESLEVLSVAEWNEKYAQFPLKLGEGDR